MPISRRNFSKLVLGGTSLAAIATGLPAAFLRSPLARAAGTPATCDPANARFLVLSVSGAGDPINANCPGAFDLPGVIHPPGDDFVATPIKLGSTASTASRLWSMLPQAVLDRACFLHHATRTVVHPDMPKVLRLMGATNNGEMLPSLLAAQLAPCLGTIQSVPVSVGSVPLTAGGVVLPSLRPTALKQLLVKNNSPLLALRALRDKQLDAIHAILKKDGTTEQRKYLDARAQSRADTRKLADDAATLFSAINNDGPDNQVVAAVGLIRLGVTPVVALTLPFGADNHTDDNLQNESTQHATGIAAIVKLMDLLQQNALQRVTFATLNVFGRTLARKGLVGRDHWPRHAVSVLIGKGVKPGIVGGLAPLDDDFTSVGIDSTTGRGVPNGGDIPYEESLSAVGKTIGAAVGVVPSVLDAAITGGKRISAAVG